MDKETIKQEFETLKLSDVTINRVWDIYQYGDIESYVEALRYMVVLLAREKQDLSKRLLKKIKNTPIQVKVDYDPDKDYHLQAFKKKMENIWK